MRQSYNLLFEKFLLVNFTRSIPMSDEFRVLNSLDDLIHVRIDRWKLFTRHDLGDATRLRTWIWMAGLRCALVRMSLVRLASQKS